MCTITSGDAGQAGNQGGLDSAEASGGGGGGGDERGAEVDGADLGDSGSAAECLY
jgi:hypothetical protein